MKNKWLKHAQVWMVQYGFVALASVISIFIVGSLLSFYPTDPSWFYHVSGNQAVQNIFGRFGAHCAAWLIYLFGRGAFLFIPVLLYFGYFFIRQLSFKKQWDRIVGIFFGFAAFTTFLQVNNIGSYRFSYAGGVTGRYLQYKFLFHFDHLVQQIVVSAVLFIAMILISQFAFLVAAQKFLHAMQYVFHKNSVFAKAFFFVFNILSTSLHFLFAGIARTFNVLSGKLIKKVGRSVVSFEQDKNVDDDIEHVVQDLFWDDYVNKHKEQHVEEHIDLQQTNYAVADASEETMVVDEVGPQAQHELFATHDVSVKKYKLPFVAPVKGNDVDEQEQEEKLGHQAQTLEEKLAQFGIEGKVVGMHPGPVVTLFEYKPDIKVKVSRILALEDDLAMALKALSIRIIAPIPGKSVVGFEVANPDRQNVMFDKILNSTSFQDNQGFLPLILGQDTLGENIVSDLARMPHLLIAGSTGSGKSVALNAMLVSLLCARDPEDLKLIIIDPKRLEFTAYEDIAHLLFPIITDTKKAVPILKWVVRTMEQRYETMADNGARNILDYQKLSQNNPELEKMPFIVVMIDELADLMMTAGKAVEDSIARIAQMARAAGIHMIVATQRPSVDVITGMIKVNFPNRISFKVTSKIDSRTILDAGGAEKLLGRGDMLFLDASQSHLVRVHGAYVSDDQIKVIVDQIKSQKEPSYLDISDFFAQQEDSQMMDGDDELYQDVLALLQDVDEVSISMLQRRFRIGYNRSARIIELLESKGLIMPADGSKMRRVVKQ